MVQCPECRDVLTYDLLEKDEFAAHYKQCFKSHRVKSLFKCDFCRKSFKAERSRTIHYISLHDQKLDWPDGAPPKTDKTHNIEIHKCQHCEKVLYFKADM